LVDIGLIISDQIKTPLTTDHQPPNRGGNMETFLFFLILFIVLSLIRSTVRIVQEYERGVIFRLGRSVGARGPGVFFLIPGIEKMMKVDLRIITLDVPTQEVITKDNVTVRVNAVIYFRVTEPNRAVIEIRDYIHATSLLSQTTLRSILGQSELDELLAQRDQLNLRLQEIIDEATDNWGIKVTAVEIKDVELPVAMQRAMAKQAEAEREKRAKVIRAEGEMQAAENLLKAADTMAQNATTMQLRYLQTLTDVATDKSSTILFPIPIDTIKYFMENLSLNYKRVSNEVDETS
jgi:regulator of protease activity HflC (stomatin/prohibitin superfamily)